MNEVISHVIEDENEINVEFIHPEARFGIWFDKKNPSESGWCWVTKDFSIHASGYMPTELMRWLRRAAIAFLEDK